MGRKPNPPAGLTAVTLAYAKTYFLRQAEDEFGKDASALREKRSIMNRMVEHLGGTRDVWTLTITELKSVRSYVIRGEFPDGAVHHPAGQLGKRRGRTTRPSKGSVTSTIRQFTKECRENGWLAGDIDLPKPTFRARKAHTGEPPPLMVYFTPEQFPEVLDAAERRHPKVRMAVALGTYAGRRISASLRLQVSHVDRRNGVIRFYERKGDDRLVVPITAEMEYELDRWWKWATRTKGVPQPDWYLIPNRKSVGDLKGPGSRAPYLNNPSTWPVNWTEPTQYVRIWSDIRMVLEQFGLTVGMNTGAHTFRRSGAVVINENHGPEVTQEFLGHKSPISTQVYTRNLTGHAKLMALAGQSVFAAQPEATVTSIHGESEAS
jgi:integrase